MSLPKITYINSSCYLPVLGRKISIRPFTLGEETNILLAQDAGTAEDFNDAIFKTIKGCILDDIDVNDLTITDIIVLFVTILDLAKGASRELRYNCIAKKSDGELCDGKIDIVIDLKSSIENINFTKVNDIIDIDENLKIKVKYPTYKDITKSLLASEKTDEEKIEELYAACIVEIYENIDTVYNDFTFEEMKEWVKTIPNEKIKEINTFFDSMPIVKLEFDLICPECGEKTHMEYTGLDGFFLIRSVE